MLSIIHQLRRWYRMDRLGEIFSSIKEELLLLNAKLDRNSSECDVFENKLKQMEVIAAEIKLSLEDKYSSLNHRYDVVENKLRQIEIFSDEIKQSLEDKYYLLSKDLGCRAEKIEGSIRHHSHNLKQSVALVSKKLPVYTKKIRCLFLVHSTETWDAQADVYNEMRNDDRFFVMVASLDRRYPGETVYSGEAHVSRFLNDQGISHIRLNIEDSFAALDLIKSFSPDIIFRQSQWEPDYPPAFNTAEISFARICVLPYGCAIISDFDVGRENSVGNIYSFDQYFHRMAWRVFCENSLTQGYYLTFHHGDPEKFVVTGYPKFKRLLSARNSPVWPIKSKQSQRLRVIWAPHYSVGDNWLGFGVFHLIYKEMLAFAIKHSETFEFVLRPHPALFANVVSEGFVLKEDLDEFLKKWCALENCNLHDSASYGEIFAASDLMLTDGITFILEYPLFDKPLIFYDSCQRVAFNELGSAAIKAAHVAFDAEYMFSLLIDFSIDPCMFSKEREGDRLNLKNLVLDDMENPARRIVENISKGFAL